MSASALNRYLDLLVDLLLVRRLRPWSGNVGVTGEPALACLITPVTAPAT